MNRSLFLRLGPLNSCRHHVQALSAAALLTSGLWVGGASICLTVFAETTVAAQDDADKAREGRWEGMRRGGGRDGFRGRGRFGGGGAMAARGGDATFGLLRSEAVQEEIELMADQKEALTKLAEEGRGQGRPDFDFRNATDEERRKFFEQRQKLQQERIAKMKMELEVILLPEQLDRLEQIGLQVRGPMALSDEDVIERLAISKEQQAAMSSAREEAIRTMREQIGELARSGDRDAMREKMRQLRQDMEEKMLAELTEQQRQQFEEMKGEPFETADLGFGGRRGGRGFSGGRGFRGGAGDRFRGERQAAEGS